MGSRLPDEVKSTFTLRLPEKVAERTHSAARAAGLPRNDLILLALTEYLERQDAPQSKAPRRPDAKSRYLQAIRESYGEETALQQAGVARRTLAKWIEDPGFAEEVQAAQSYYLESLEQTLVSIGRGERKGTAGALATVLAAHHAAYGRAKAELVNKILAFEHGELLRAIREELGETCRDGLDRACERYEIGQAVRLAWLTE